MDGDIIERIQMIAGWRHGREFDFKRIAITNEQIQRYNLPPMPTDAATLKKYENDPRKDNYQKKNGGLKIAVELEALSSAYPDDYKKLIQDTATEFWDESIYKVEMKKRSTPEYKKEIRQTVYDKTQAFLDDYDVDDVGNDSDSDTVNS